MAWDIRYNKHRLRQILHVIKTVRSWQLIVILLLAILASASLLRLNSLGMAERRSAVLAADEKGDNAATKTAIVDLQRYISRHMNTDMAGGFYLTKSYERDRDAALASANDVSNPNSSVYQQASIECRERFRGGTSSFRNDYVQCVIERVSALSPQADTAADINLPRADAYKISFVSPLWSPDIAGFSVAFCLLIIIVLVLRLVALVVLRALVRRHYHSV